MKTIGARKKLIKEKESTAQEAERYQAELKSEQGRLKAHQHEFEIAVRNLERSQATVT
jgi:peptidoglycan hydrolase CwlO-like protein